MNFKHINLAEHGEKLKQYENQWIAISEENEVVGAGPTPQEALRVAEETRKEVVLFRVPPLDVGLAPVSL